MRFINLLLTLIILLLLSLSGSFGYFVYTIANNDFELPGIPQTTRIYDRYDQLIAVRYLENRIAIPLEEIPATVIQATIAIEDRRFYRHLGFDFTGLGRAMLNNIKQRRLTQGGSTITQQLAKNLFLTHEQTLERKIKEASYTVHLERTLSKDEILEKYLNTIYYGHSAYGIEMAAQTYFGKNAASLTLAEAALLAGIPKGPYFYSPLIDLRAAVERQEMVLQAMIEAGFISEADKIEALDEPLKITGPAGSEQFSYFIDHVINMELAALFDGDLNPVFKGGLEVYTTLDPLVQQAAEEIIAGMPQLRLDHNGLRQPQGALVAIDPQTGYVKALVGGYNFGETMLNRAFALRSPGSAFKPFVYAAALEQGQPVTAVQLCAPLTLVEPGIDQPYQPTDFSGDFHHRELDMREALALSCNIHAIKTYIEIGRDKTVEMARRLGINSPLASYYSLPLGTSEVTLMELTAAFAPFANGGYRIEPAVLRRVVDARGKVIYESHPRRQHVLDERVAFLITDMLKGVLKEGGTASGVEAILRRPAAGKSGTSEESKNAHMVGYTPQLVAGLYIGDDFGEPLGTTGGGLAAPLWAKFMERALEGYQVKDFLLPEGVVRVTICRETGLIQSPSCSGPGRKEYFVSGSEPSESCSAGSCPHCPPDLGWPWSPWYQRRP